jgi:hypothetical protein
MNDIASMNDYIGKRVERVDIGNCAREILNSPVGVRRIQRNMRVRDLRNDHAADHPPALLIAGWPNTP